MREHVTIVPADRLIIVDGEPLRFDFAAPENLRAIQWHAGKGHMEFTDDSNHALSGQALYDADVAPYVALWTEGKARREAAADKLPTQAEPDAARIAAIKVLLAALDARSARPLRAVAAGTATEDDHASLAALEAEAQTLRAELAGLEAENTQDRA